MELKPEEQMKIFGKVIYPPDLTSLRDEIAMRAMGVLLEVNIKTSYDGMMEIIAREAYQMADSMLSARDAK